MKTFILALFAAVSTAASAQNWNQNQWHQPMATVVQAVPQFEQVNVGGGCQPNYGGGQQRNNTGAVIGGIAGAAIGNGVGRGDGRTAAMAIFSGVGAVIGDRMDNNQGNQYGNQYQQDCRPQYQQRQVGTQVVAEYEGQRVNGYVRRPVQVGEQIRVRVNVQIAE